MSVDLEAARVQDLGAALGRRERLRGADDLRAARARRRAAGPLSGIGWFDTVADAGGGGGAAREARRGHRQLRGGLAAAARRRGARADGPGGAGGGAGRAPRRAAGEPGGLRRGRAEPHLRLHRRRRRAARGVDARRRVGVQPASRSRPGRGRAAPRCGCSAPRTRRCGRRSGTTPSARADAGRRSWTASPSSLIPAYAGEGEILSVGGMARRGVRQVDYDSATRPHHRRDVPAVPVARS